MTRFFNDPASLYPTEMRTSTPSYGCNCSMLRSHIVTSLLKLQYKVINMAAIISELLPAHYRIFKVILFNKDVNGVDS